MTSALKPGAVVHLHGLKAAAGLNGIVAVCQKWDEASHRWHVRLSTGETKSIKEANLVRIQSASEATAVEKEPTSQRLETVSADVAGKEPHPSSATASLLARRKRCVPTSTSTDNKQCQPPTWERLANCTTQKLAEPPRIDDNGETAAVEQSKENTPVVTSDATSHSDSISKMNEPCGFQLQLGDAVQLHGLTCRPELNGAFGTCERWDPSCNRWQVQLDVALWGCEIQMFKEEHLLRVITASAVETAPQAFSEPVLPKREKKPSVANCNVDVANGRAEDNRDLEAEKRNMVKRPRRDLGNDFDGPETDRNCAIEVKLPKPSSPPIIFGPPGVAQSKIDAPEPCHKVVTPPKTQGRKRIEAREITVTGFDKGRYVSAEVSEAMRKLVDMKVISELPHHLASGPKIMLDSSKVLRNAQWDLAESILQKFMDPKISGARHQLTTTRVIKLFSFVKTEADAKLFKMLLKKLCCLSKPSRPEDPGVWTLRDEFLRKPVSVQAEAAE